MLNAAEPWSVVMLDDVVEPEGEEVYGPLPSVPIEAGVGDLSTISPEGLELGLQVYGSDSDGSLEDRGRDHDSSLAIVPGEIVVAIRGGDDAGETGGSFAQAAFLELIGQDESVSTSDILSLPEPGGDQLHLVQLRYDADRDELDLAAELSQLEQVAWAAPNYVYVGEDPRDFAPNDPGYPYQYHHPLMQNDLAWDTTIGDPSIVIAVTDDGVDLDHRDLAANIWTNPAEAAGAAGVDDDGNGYIDDLYGWDFADGDNDPNHVAEDWHGTHVAGIAAAVTDDGTGVAGVAGGATIMPLRWYGSGAWTSAVIAETFAYAADNGAQIVSTSYNMGGWAGDPTVIAAYQYLYDHDVLHLGSASNDSGPDPAHQAFGQSLLVASTDSEDHRSDFSNYGTGIDVAAPGTYIVSTYTDGRYASASGTSMAAPNAAGVAALIWSANPTWSRDEVAAQLLGTADDIDALNPGYEGLLGSGRANSYRALTETLPAPRVESIRGLPANGSTGGHAPAIAGFELVFDQVMDPESVNRAESFELRSAGSNGTFGDGDDVVYTLAHPTYLIGTNVLDLDITDGPLGLGAYRFTADSGGLQNPFGTDLDGDGNGTGGDDYVHTFTIGLAALDAVEPLGSLIFSEPEVSGSIATPGEVDTYTLDLDAGQTITVVVEADVPLRASVEVLDPASAQLAAATAASAGDDVLFQTLPAATAGTYTVSLAGASSTTGDYTLDVILNAAVEEEDLVGTPNDTLATAQDLGGSFVSLAGGAADRGAVIGGLAALDTEDFESGALDAQWATFSSRTAGRIEVTGAYGTAGGDYALLMDRAPSGARNLNEAIWTVDLSSVGQAMLSFYHAEWGDEEQSLPSSFTDSANGDGVSISEDGVTWYTVLNATSLPSGVWERVTVDLDEAAADAGIGFDSDFHIKFQQYDNSRLLADGRGYDEIVVADASEDWYRFSLADGQLASVVLAELDGSVAPALELYGASGDLLAAGVFAGNVDQAINSFRDGTSNGVPDDYFVRVSDMAGRYSLTVTREADFDVVTSSTAPVGQSSTAALGYLATVEGTALLADFTGMDSNTAMSPYEPPDTHAAAGPDHIVEVVNTAIAMYHKDGTVARPAQDLGEFLDPAIVAGETFVFDPVVAYDELEGRWIVAVLCGADYGAPETDLLYAVSDTDDPTGFWAEQHRIDFGGISPGLFADYPKVGWNADAHVFALNMFSQYYYEDVNVVAIDKASVLDADPATFTHYITERPYTSFTMAAATMHGSAPGDPMWFVEESGWGGERTDVRVVRMDNPASATPTYTDYLVPVNAYSSGNMPYAAQPGDVLIMLNDARMLNAEWCEDRLVATHNVNMGGEIAVRWYEFDVSTAMPTLAQEGEIDPGPGVATYFPSIAINPFGDIGFTYMQSSSEEFVSMYVTGQEAGAPSGTTAASALVRAGNQVYPGWRGGDYSGITVDPVDGTFWAANEVSLEYPAPDPLWSTWIGQFAMSSPRNLDWYEFSVNAGDALSVETSTPLDGPNEPANDLDPAVELYAPDGSLVASDDNSAADGRNVALSHTAAQTGVYRLQLTGVSESVGEYFLKIEGATGAEVAPHATGSDPTDGGTVATFPATYTVHFSESLLFTSVDAADLVVGGLPATSVTVIDGDTLQFGVDPAADIGDGVYAASMAAGSVADLQGSALAAGFSATFELDATGPTITSTSWNGTALPTDAILPEGPLTFEAVFSERLRLLASARRGLKLPSVSDVVLTDLITGETIEADSVSYDWITETFTAEFGHLSESAYELRLEAEVFEDSLGNDLDGEPLGGNVDGTVTGDGVPGGDYAIEFSLDATETPADGFELLRPFGSLMSESDNNAGLLNEAGDLDSFTFFAEAGQTISAAADPDEPGVTLQIELVGLSSTFTAAAAGEPAVLPPTVVPATGEYEVRVGGDGVATYAVDLFRNAALEQQVGDTGDGNELAIDDSFVNLGSGRYGVLGAVDPRVLLWSEDFDLGIPPSWTVRDKAGSGVVWTDIAGSGEHGNYTNGSGDAATVSSDLAGEAEYNTKLISPPFDLAGLLSPQLTYTANFQVYSGTERLDVDLWDGSDWNNLLRWNESHGSFSSPPGEDVVIDLSPYAGTSGLKVRWHYYNRGVDDWDWYAQIDDVAVTHAVPETDEYTVDLTGKAGQPIDVILSGQSGADLSGETLELLDVDGSTVLATAAADPVQSGVDAANYDLGILDFVVPTDGVYTLRVTSALTDGDYGIVVTDSLTFDTGLNDDFATDPLRTLDHTGAGLGRVGATEAYILDDGSSETGVGLRDEGDLMWINVFDAQSDLKEISAISLAWWDEDLSPWGHTRVLLYDDPNDDGDPSDGVLLTWTAVRIADPGTDRFTTVPITPTVVEGKFFVAALVKYSNPDTYPAALDQSSSLGQSWAAISDEGEFDINDLTNNDLDLLDRIGLPGNWLLRAVGRDLVDSYEVTLAAGEIAKFGTQALFADPAGSPLNDLDPEIRVIHRDGTTVIAADQDSLDGRDALVVFEAPAAGTYTFEVWATSGAGEYLLRRLEDLTLSAADDPTGDGLDTGGGDLDTIRLVRNGSLVEEYVDGVLARSFPFASVHQLTVEGSTDDDTLVVDFANGNPIPAGGLAFNGGVGGSDSITLDQGAFPDLDTIHHVYTNAEATDHTGRIELDFDGAGIDRTITYTGLEPIADNLVAADRIFTLSDVASNEVYLGDSVGNAGQSQIAGATIEDTVFSNPTNSLTVNLGDLDDFVWLQDMDADFAPAGDGVEAPLIVNGGAGGDNFVIESSQRADGGGYGSVRVDGGAGHDGFHVGQLILVPTWTISLESIVSNVDIVGGEDGPSGDYLCVVHDWPSGRDGVTITSTSISGASTGAIDYGDIEYLEYVAYDSVGTLRTVDVLGTAADTIYEVGVAVMSGSGPVATVGNTSANFGDGSGSLDLIEGPILFELEDLYGATGTLQIDDTGDTTADTVSISREYADVAVFGLSPAPIIFYEGLEILDLRTGSGGNTVTIDADGLADSSTFTGSTGVDHFILDVDSDIDATSLTFKGGDPATDEAHRDVLEINDLGGGARTLGVGYPTPADGGLSVTGFAIPVDVESMETVAYAGDGANDDVVVVAATTDADAIVVTPTGPNSADVRLDGGPALGMPGPDLSLAGLDATSGLAIDGRTPTGGLVGDTLVHDSTGPGVVVTPTGAGEGHVTEPGSIQVSFAEIETVVSPALVLDADTSGGNGTGNGTPDTFTLVQNGADLEVWLDATLSLSVPVGLIQSLEINGSSDDDTLVVDLSNGDPIPVGGITFNGDVGGSDSIVLDQGAFPDLDTVHHVYTNAVATDHEGRIDLDLDGGGIDRTITYTGLEPIIDNLVAADRTFTLPDASFNEVYLSDSVGNAGQSEIVGATIEDTVFSNPTNSLTVALGSQGDWVYLRDLDADFAPAGVGVAAPLMINGGTGTDLFFIESSGQADGGGYGSVRADGGAGSDFFSVGYGANGNLDKIVSDVTIVGGGTAEEPGDDVLRIRDEFPTTGDPFITIAAASITRVSTGAINYSGVEELRLESRTPLPAVIDVMSTAFGTTYDVSNVCDLTATVTVGNANADFGDGNGNLDAIAGSIELRLDAGSALVQIDDTGGTTADTASISLDGWVTTIAGLSPAPVSLDCFSGFDLDLRTGTGNDTIDVEPPVASESMRIDSGGGDDTITINGDGLGGENVFVGNAGVDRFVLNVTSDLGASAMLFPLTSLQIEGSDPNGDPGSRDVLEINDLGGGSRTLALEYPSPADGSLTVTGFAVPINVGSMETVAYTGDDANDDAATVVGTTDADLFFVEPTGPASANVLLDAGPDLAFAGLDATTGLAIDGSTPTGGSPGDRLAYRSTGSNETVVPTGAGEGYITRPGLIQVNFQEIESAEVVRSRVVIDADDPGGNGTDNGLADTFRLVMNGLDLEVWIDDSLSQSLPLAFSQSIAIEGSWDNDGLIVDCSSGLIPASISFTAGPGMDSLLIHGAPADPVGVVVYTPGPGVGQGRLEYDDSMAIAFTGLEPVIDLVEASTLVVTGTNAANTINYARGHNSGTELVSDATTGLVSVDSFETIEFANKAMLWLDGLAGSDEIDLDNSTTPTDLAEILVDGGGGSDSDRLVLNGTRRNDEFTYMPLDPTSGVVAIGDLPVSFAAVESVFLNGGASLADTIDVVAQRLLSRFTFTPGATRDSGTIQVNSGLADFVPLSFDGIGLLGGIALSGGIFETVVYNGTSSNDTFTVDSSGGVRLRNSAGAHVMIDAGSAEHVILDGLAGGDTFNVDGDHPYSLLSVVGGDPSSGDVLKLTAPLGPSVATLQTADLAYGDFPGIDPTDQIIQTGESIALVRGVELITYTGQNGDDMLIVMPGFGATGMRVDSAPGPRFDRVVSDSLPDVHFTDLAAFITIPVFSDYTVTFAPNCLWGADDYMVLAYEGTHATMVIEGNDGPNAYTVENEVGNLMVTGDTLSPLTIIGGGWLAELRLNTLGGDDTVTVDVDDAALLHVLNVPIMFDGGAGSDLLLVTGTPDTTVDEVVYTPGADVTAGRLVYEDEDDLALMTIDFVNLEPVVDLVRANTLTVNGTNADNAIDYGPSPTEADRGLVSVDNFETIEFANKTNLVINALAGNDEINIGSPTTAMGLVGRSITIHAGEGRDTLTVNAVPGLFDPLLVEPMAQGVGTVHHLDGYLSFVNYSGLEQLDLVGQLADGDSMGVAGTIGDDLLEHLPGATSDSGQIVGTMDQSNATEDGPFSLGTIGFRGMVQASLLAPGTFLQTGGEDTLVYHGTASDDDISLEDGVVSNTVSGQVQTEVAYGSSASVYLKGHDGDDAFTIPADIEIEIFVKGGGPSGSDTLELIAPLGPSAVWIEPSFGNPTDQFIGMVNSTAHVSGIELITYVGAYEGEDADDTLMVFPGLGASHMRVDRAPVLGYDRATSDSLPEIHFGGLATFEALSAFSDYTFTFAPAWLMGAREYVVDEFLGSATLVVEGSDDADNYTVSGVAGGVEVSRDAWLSLVTITARGWLDELRIDGGGRRRPRDGGRGAR